MAATKIKQQMILQYDGKEVEISAIEAEIKKCWKEAGHKLTEIQTLDVYVKPQEAAAYYVVNGEIEGKVSLY